jgi:hypothetical protein
LLQAAWGMIQALILDQIKPVSSWQTFNKFNNWASDLLCRDSWWTVYNPARLMLNVPLSLTHCSSAWWLINRKPMSLWLPDARSSM